MSTPASLPRVEYGECPRCGALMLPVLNPSPCGHDEPPIVRRLTEPGTVYSWTRTVRPAERLLAIVDFFDGALRAAAPVEGVSSVAIGDRVIAAPGSTTPLMFVSTEGTES